MSPLKDVRLQKCCIDPITEINRTIKLGNALSCVLVVTPVFKAFFYPYGASQLASLASSTMSITTEEWVLLGRSVQVAGEPFRQTVYDTAFQHSLYHVKDNNGKLQQFWEGVTDAFAE